MCSAEVVLARRLACLFSPLRIWTILACKLSTLLFTYSRHFFLPFALAFVVSIHLVIDDLRVTIKNHAFGLCRFGEIESCHQSFIFCFIVGGRKVEADHTFNLVSFKRKKHNTYFFSLPIRRPVCMYALLEAFLCPLVFPVSELCYEISYDLSLDCRVRAVLNVKLTQLYRL